MEHGIFEYFVITLDRPTPDSFEKHFMMTLTTLTIWITTTTTTMMMMVVIVVSSTVRNNNELDKWCQNYARNAAEVTHATQFDLWTLIYYYLFIWLKSVA